MTQTKKSTILVVDDIAENIDVVGGALSSEYNILVALNGNDALAIAKATPQPDLILLDVMMPELDVTRLKIIRKLGKAGEFKDIETGLHVIRMSKYAELMGKALGMSDDEAELLLNVVPMHDIGKIGIADKILLKPDMMRLNCILINWIDISLPVLREKISINFLINTK